MLRGSGKVGVRAEALFVQVRAKAALPASCRAGSPKQSPARKALDLQSSTFRDAGGRGFRGPDQSAHAIPPLQDRSPKAARAVFARTSQSLGAWLKNTPDGCEWVYVGKLGVRNPPSRRYLIMRLVMHLSKVMKAFTTSILPVAKHISNPSLRSTCASVCICMYRTRIYIYISVLYIYI